MLAGIGVIVVPGACVEAADIAGDFGDRDAEGDTRFDAGSDAPRALTESPDVEADHRARRPPFGNPVIPTDNAAWVGPGHGSVVAVNGLDYFVHHAWTNAGDDTAGPGGRKVLVDRITWSNEWSSIANGSPSSTMQPSPGESF